MLHALATLCKYSLNFNQISTKLNLGSVEEVGTSPHAQAPAGVGGWGSDQKGVQLSLKNRWGVGEVEGEHKQLLRTAGRAARQL